MEASQELDAKRYLRLVYRKRYLFVGIVVLVTSLVVALGYILPKKYEATSTVLIERNFLNDIMKSIAVTPSIDDRVKAVSAIMKSRPLVMKVLKDLDLDLTQKTEMEVEKLVKTFQKDTEVKIEVNKASRKDMDMFAVSLRHKSPVTARDFVNGLVRRYIEESLSSKRDETYGASKFLLDQIDRFKEKISAIEDKISNMNQQKGVASQEKLVLLQKRMDELLLQYTERHPEVIKAKDEIEILKGQVKGKKRGSSKSREAETSLPAMGFDNQPAQSEQGKQDAATGTRTAANEPSVRAQAGGETFLARGVDEQKIKELERDRDTYRKIYEELLGALGRSEVSSHIEVEDKGGTLKILEPAVLPLNPVSPNRVNMILLGIIGGLGAGFAALIILESMHRSVDAADTVGTFGLPVLAVIPHIELPQEARSKRIKDTFLYIFTGIYYTGVVAVLAVELIAREMR